MTNLTIELQYGDIHDIFVNLQKSKLISLRGTPSRRLFTNFDISILNIFGNDIAHTRNDLLVDGSKALADVCRAIDELMDKINKYSLDVS